MPYLSRREKKKEYNVLLCVGLSKTVRFTIKKKGERRKKKKKKEKTEGELIPT